MRVQLSPLEARVIGSLLEKEIVTPEQYPLSLGALTLACNQKTSREPVMQLSETEVQAVVDDLMKHHLVLERSGFGSRVPKYQQRFCNTEFAELKFTPQELGIICVLLLRGPQTPGELRTRTNRLCEFHDVQETEAVLQRLAEREDGPFVVRLAREPGKRESRYAHLFSGEVSGVDDSPYVATTADDSGQQQRIDLLEAEVAALRAELDALKAQVQALSG